MSEWDEERQQRRLDRVKRWRQRDAAPPITPYPRRHSPTDPRRQLLFLACAFLVLGVVLGMFLLAGDFPLLGVVLTCVMPLCGLPVVVLWGRGAIFANMSDRWRDNFLSASTVTTATVRYRRIVETSGPDTSFGHAGEMVPIYLAGIEFEAEEGARITWMQIEVAVGSQLWRDLREDSEFPLRLRYTNANPRVVLLEGERDWF